MDAARTPFVRLSSFLAIALLLTASAWAQGPVSVNGGSAATIALNSGALFGSVAVTSTGGPTDFTISDPVNGGVLPAGFSWLNITASSMTTPATVTASLTRDLAVFGAGPFSATLQIAGGGATATVTVTFTVGGGGGGAPVISVSQNTLTSTSPVAMGDSAAGVITLSSTSATPTAFSVTSSAPGTGWTLEADPASGQVSSTAPVVLTITATITNSVSATHTGAVTITPAGMAAITITVTVEANGGGGGGGGTSTKVVTPAALRFDHQVGMTPGPAPQYIFVPGPMGRAFSASSDESWVTVASEIDEEPQALTVAVNTASLVARSQPYTATITIEDELGTAYVPVSLYVTDGVILRANPGSLIYDIAAYVTSTQNISVAASDGSDVVVVAAAGPSATWLTPVVTPNAETGGADVAVTVNSTGLTPGTYQGSLTISATEMANSPVTIPVVMIVDQGYTEVIGGSLTVSTPVLNFQVLPDGSGSQLFTVDASAGSFTASVTSNSPWLSINPAGGGAHEQITASVDATGLTAGTYTGTIQVVSGPENRIIQVTMVVSSSSSGGNVTADKTSLSFSYQVGGSAPAIQQVGVTNTSAGDAIPFTATSSAAWLQVTPGTGSTPSTLTVKVLPASLPAGSLPVATITISPAGGSPVYIPVTVNVSAPSLSVSRTELNFVYRLGDSGFPAAQLVQVSGGASVPFTATASSAGNWLSVTPASGYASPANISVAVNPAALEAGTTYQGTVTVAAGGPAVGGNTINVSLQVLAPLPTITSVGNAASYLGGSIAPGEIITIGGTYLGPTTAVSGTVQNGRFLTTAGSVQVLVNGYEAPILYASAGQINAVVPFEIAQQRTANVWVKFLNQTSNSVSLPVSGSAPGIFTAPALGRGQGAILNADYSFNGDRATAKGSSVMVFFTGGGQTAPGGDTGLITVARPTAPLTPAPILPIAVRIDGQPVQVEWVGEAPGLVSGAMQVNVKIPSNARSGDLPIVLSIGGNSSQNDVYVKVQ